MTEPDRELRDRRRSGAGCVPTLQSIADDWVGDAIDQAVAELTLEADGTFDHDKIDAAVRQAIELSRTDVAAHIFESLRKDAPRTLRAEAVERAGFENRLGDVWGRAFGTLRSMIVAATELGIEFDKRHRPQAAADHDVVFEALGKLYARGVRIANEVLHLMEGGFAMGALARWRALHEVVVVAMFLRDRRADTAERYLLHSHAAAYAGAQTHQKHAGRLHQDAFEAVEIDEMRETRDQLIKQFDSPCYPLDYGWALAALNRGCTQAAHAARPGRAHRVSFDRIEAAVDLDHYRPYYRMASRGIHADARALYWDLGLQRSDMLWYGGSNTGMADPGSVTAISLSLLVMTLMLQRTSATSLMYVGVFHLYVGAANDAFDNAHRELERRQERVEQGRSPTPSALERLRASIGRIRGRGEHGS